MPRNTKKADKKSSRGRAAELAPVRCLTTIGEVPRLLSSMGRFASENSGFESSAVNSAVLEDMASATDINLAALAPLRHKVFNFDAALRWGFLLSNIVPRILDEDGADLADGFDLLRYNAELVSVYDTAVESGVWEFCVEDETDDDDGDDDDGGGGDDEKQELG
jgi:hypothetical protein